MITRVLHPHLGGRWGGIMCELCELYGDAILSPREAASILQIGVATVRKRAEENGWPVIRTDGGQRRYRAVDVYTTLPGKKCYYSRFVL